MSLFRSEAISHQSERLSGVITFAQPVSIKLTITSLVLISIAVIFFLFTAEYFRKETVRGFLMPSKGGTIDNLTVKEIVKVEKSQALATIIIHQNSADGLSLSSKLQKQLTSQLKLLDEEISQYQSILSKASQRLENKVLALESEKTALAGQLTLASEKLELLLTKHVDVGKLNNNRFISKLEKENQQHAILEAKQEKQNIACLLLQQNNQINQISFDITNLPLQFTLCINSLLRRKGRHRKSTSASTKQA